jgi:WS/DGAT/MGAT family acyltransferase
VDGCFFDLAEMKRIRTAVSGATVNDVALTVVSGALRLYLETKDALPAQSLVAACPINVGSEQDADEGRGNLLSVMTPLLHTDVADPLERLAAIQKSTRASKARLDTVGPRTMTEIPMNLPAPLARGLFPLLAEVSLRTETLPYNTMITNVSGIQKPMYLAGAKMIRVMGMGPAIDQAALFHVVFSYDGMVSIAFTACREMLPDPDLYAQCLEAAYQELKESLPAEPGASRPKAPSRKTSSRKIPPKKKTSSKKAAPGAKKPAKKKAKSARVAGVPSKKAGASRGGSAG